MADLTGRRLGPYQLQKKLGQGGMGAVYVGVHQTLDVPRAIKVLLPNEVDEAVVERFVREGVISASLRHPGIVEIFDVGEQDDFHYLVMELIDGVSLLQLLRSSGALPIERVVALLRQVAAALDYAHARGVVHRDIKPSNIIVTPDDQVKLIDFGIARALDESRLTRVGVVVGTFEYMAPEVVTEGGGSPGADRYALGIVAYQMITGRVPFTGESAHSIMYRQVHEPPPPPSRYRGDLTDAVEQALLRQLSKSPDDRFPSALAFIDALEAVERPPAATQATEIADITRPGFDRPTPGSGQTPLPRSGRVTRPAVARPGTATMTPPAAQALPSAYTESPSFSSINIARPPTAAATSMTSAARRRSNTGPILAAVALIAVLLAGAVVMFQPVRDVVLAPFAAAAPTVAPTASTALRGATTIPTTQPAVTPAVTPATPTAQVVTATPLAVTPTAAPITPTLVPTPAPNDRLAQARAAAGAGNFAAALDILDNLRSTNPDLAGLDDARYDVHMGWAKALLDQGKPDDSNAQLGEALKIRPNDAAALDAQKQIVLSKNYASMEANWGKDDEAAIKALEDNMALDPGYRDTRQKLYALLIAKADRLTDAGERDEAFSVLMHALDVNPDGAEAKQRLAAYTPTPVPPTATPVPAPQAPPANTAPRTTTNNTYTPPASSAPRAAPSGGGSAAPSSGGGGAPPRGPIPP